MKPSPREVVVKFGAIMSTEVTVSFLLRMGVAWALWKTPLRGVAWKVPLPPVP